MTVQDDETRARRALYSMSRKDLQRIAFAAWQYHQQTNQLCAVHDLGESDEIADCDCEWVTATRNAASETLSDLLPG